MDCLLKGCSSPDSHVNSVMLLRYSIVVMPRPSYYRCSSPKLNLYFSTRLMSKQPSWILLAVWLNTAYFPSSTRSVSFINVKRLCSVIISILFWSKGFVFILLPLSFNNQNFIFNSILFKYIFFTTRVGMSQFFLIFFTTLKSWNCFPRDILFWIPYSGLQSTQNYCYIMWWRGRFHCVLCYI